MEKKERFLGCMYGLALGDALGYPVEFMTRDEILRGVGPKGVTGFDSLEKARLDHAHPIGFYSDDTQMTLATANGLLSSNTTSRKEIMDNIAREYTLWANSPDNNRAPGTTCMQGIRNMIANGGNWEKSGVPTGDGCGAAMRTAPIGLRFYRDFDKLNEIAHSASKCTHGENSAIISGMNVARVVGRILKYSRPDPMDIYQETLLSTKVGPPADVSFAEKLERVKKVLRYTDEAKALNELGEGWRGDEAFTMAMYCFLKSPEDFRRTVLRAANITGDSDSVASIAGAFSGAYNGIRAIPQEWISKLERTELIRETAERLFRKTEEAKD